MMSCGAVETDCLLALQAQFKDVNDADLKAMDSEISALSAEAQSLTQSCRLLDTGGVDPTSSQHGLRFLTAL